MLEVVGCHLVLVDNCCKWLSRGWVDGSFCKVFTVQVWWPECKRREWGMKGEGEVRQTPRTHWLASPAGFVSFRFWRLLLKSRQGVTERSTYLLLTIGLHKHAHNCTRTHVCKWMDTTHNTHILTHTQGYI